MKPKLLRVTTADISLKHLLKGQLRFLNQRFEVVGVAADTGDLQSVAEREGIRVVEVPMHREISLQADWQCLRRLYRLFRQEQPTIVHANTPKGSLLAMLAGKLAGVPHRIYTVTGLRYQGADGKLRYLLKTMERLTCRCATKVIPEGRGVMEALRRDGITQKPLEIVHNGNINGIDTDYFSEAACETTREEMRRKLDLAPDDFAFIFIGRIVKDKGMNELAEAMRRITVADDRCKLILVGMFEPELDPLEGDNEKFFRQSPHVRFTGWRTDVRPYLLAADALVFPSYREGFPNVVLQAGAMQLPSIVTDINGCNEIVEEGRNGTIIPAGNREALQDAMLNFLTHPDRVARMAAEARALVVQRYEQSDVWNALLTVYEKLLRPSS